MSEGIKIISPFWPGLIIYCDTPEEAKGVTFGLMAGIPKTPEGKRAYWRQKQRESRERRQAVRRSAATAPANVKGV